MSDCVQVNLRITTNSNQGGRKYMEDTYAIALQRLNPLDKESPISLAYFGIFDGHGGKEAAEFARQNLCQHILEQDDFWSENSNDKQILSAIRKGFLSCHNDMWNHVEKWTKTSSGLTSTSGCTASVVFVRGNKLYIGHVGDSSIVIGEGGTLYKCWKANRITRDHKPEDPLELKRIRESGGNVLCKAGVHRVVWNRQKSVTSSNYYRNEHVKTTYEYEQIPFLAISRALGDLWSLNKHTNLYSVSPEPELTVIEIDPNKHRCLILASDGLWNMITPEVAVEIVRNCDVKTEQMILNSEDDDDRPFRNPSHELVQKALVSWKERMLRADNITCITVMLDPPGPPFSECILNKKKQISSSAYSLCTDGTIEVDQTSPMITGETPRRPKRVGQRKEHILAPISNGSTPVRTPKRPASDDITEMLDDTPRRKLIKINQQKENNTAPCLKDQLEILPVPSTNSEDDDQEFSPLTQQTNKISTFDDDLARKVEQCFRNNTKEQQSDVDMIETDESNQPNNQNNNNKQKSSTRRRSRFRFSFSNNHNSSEEDEEEIETNSKRKSRLFRTLSASIINHENETTMSSSRRRKSYSTTGLANELKNIPNNTNTTITTTITKNNCTEQPTNIDKKSTKIKSSLANRVKRAFFRPHS
ncbi:unnamed protein product [Rotaria magnacalcarata]|uniref:PPM-type phosphatase domain-containing protein n=2 Tax=Rotaria magnacalcarata TaxID=392030 RepID=A0A816ZGB6_9BILA|nr:unnamed protein product [Rotaria magnacalcarata]CAF3894834.1 unnamed protein product [Rotaria magnacalcarata]